MVDAAVAAGYRWTASARDLTTGITPGARAAGNGRRDVLLAEPTLLAQGRLVHFTTNFQATSSIDRALAILDQGGLLAVKAHIAKQFGDHVMLDGLDELYTNYLDLLFGELDRRYGEALWWTTMGAIAERVHEPPGAT